jgi:hypothetical protein
MVDSPQGMPGRKPDADPFEKRYLSQFADPAFEPLPPFGSNADPRLPSQRKTACGRPASQPARRGVRGRSCGCWRPGSASGNFACAKNVYDRDGGRNGSARRD